MDRNSSLKPTVPTPNVLIVAPEMCRGDSAAGDLRLQRILEILATSAKVDFLVPQAEPRRSDPAHRYWQILRDAGVGIVDSTLYWHLTTWCESQSRPYDWIIAEFWYQAEHILNNVDFIRLRQSGIRFAIDTVDVHFLREQTAVERGVKDYGTAEEIDARKKRELSTYRMADLLIAASTEDSQALAEEVPDCRILIVPIIVLPLPRSNGPRDKMLVFIGGFRHAPNVDGVLWFVREIFQLVTAKQPEAKLAIIGSHTPVEIHELRHVPGVRVVGFAYDTSPWLDEAAVSIAPLRYGAGMKGKVTEALSAGTPVVTTTFGAQGLGAVPGVHLHVADTAQAFAEAVVACLEDPIAAEVMGSQGRELVKSICGVERVRCDLLNALTCQNHDRPTFGNRRRLMHRSRAMVHCQLVILRRKYWQIGSWLVRQLRHFLTLLRPIAVGTRAGGNKEKSNV